MSPLTKRLPRELKHNLGKYLGIFLLMALSCALVSGFLVAASSIQTIMGTFRDDYTVEDGRFTTNFEATDKAIAAVEELGADVYPLFSFDLATHLAGAAADGGDLDATVRVYQMRDKVDIASYVEGTAPTQAGQIALDRVFAANAGLGVGDTVTLQGKDYTVCGILTLPDYCASIQNNSDFTINAMSFGVAEVAPVEFEALLSDSEHYSPSYTYAFVLHDRNMALNERVDLESDMMDAITDNDSMVNDFIDCDSNQGINYALEDTEGDSTMWEALFFIIIVIMAFVFVVLTGSTIEAESASIGTLMAMGYTRREIVLHYLAMPTLVGMAACVAGNALGYGRIVYAMKDLYYNSYNFPTFAVTWDWNTFVLTTVVPFVLLVGITAAGLICHMSATPLQFLRHEAQRRRTRRNLRLPASLPFNSRFRLRLFVRNLPNYVVLFFGMSLASLLLLFGMSVLPTMNKYADMLSEDMVAQHQYILKVPLKIDGTDQERETFSQIEEYLFGDRDSFSNIALLKLAAKAKPYEGDGAVYVNTAENSQEAIEQAERFCAYTFETPRGLVDSNEEITLYGVEPDSAYWQGIDVGEGKLVITPGIAEKCGLAVGDTMELIDKYHAKTYEVTVSGTWGNPSTMAVYMSMGDFNELLGNASTYFNGYVSNMPLNFNARYVASEVTPASMQAIADQMTDSMGGMMQMLLLVAVVIYFVLMYLLTKTVIDRAARSISYMKVFGYRDAEISRLYVRSITVTVVVSLVACLPLIIVAITALMKAVLANYAGNIVLYVPPDAIIVELVAGFATYLVVATVHLRSIKRVPLALALKVQE